MKTKIIHLLTFIILLFSMLIPTRAAHAFATTWYVTSTGDGPANQANCPGNGCRLRDAIAAAAPGDIIRFTLPINSTITTANGDFSISKELTIQASPANHLTIHGNDTERIFHIQSNPGSIMNVVIEGLTLTHGYELEQHGGAIFNQNANVTLDNMVITQNTVTNSGALGYFSAGGAIYNGGVMTITNSQITNNTATNVGGIYSGFGSTLNMTNVTVSGNQTSWVNGYAGGINLASDSSASVTSTANFDQVYIINNISATNTGGLQIGNGANVTITNSSISGNAALSAGGMQVDSNANVTISNTSISNNQALNGNSGGIFVSPDSSLTMTDSTISGNSATTYGGGLTGQQGSTITLERVAVSGNSASEGGGMYINDNATANLTNVTIAGNTASNRAGGMLVYGAANLNNITLAGNSAVNSTGGILALETINIKNSIIAVNTAPSLADCNGELNSQGYNLIENVDVLNCIISGDTSTNIIGVDPMLDSLSDNGGSTLTLNLLPGSPAIDSADNTTCASTDQRNYLRPQDGDSDDANVCDMGALEYAPYPVPYSITRANPNPTSAASVNYSVKFSEPVSNVDLADFDITTTGVAGANIANVTGSGKDYTVTVNTGTGSGTIQLELIDDDSILSSFSGNPLGGSGSVNGSASGQMYIITKSSSTLTSLVNSVLPTSRTPMVGNTVTIFNTVLNAGSETASAVTLSMNPAPAGTFSYNQTDCNTNAIIGAPNAAVDIAPGGVACYVLSFTPSAAFSATQVHIQAQASNASGTTLLPGINTWLLRATASTGPDIIALTTATDFHQVACSGANAFAVALSNVGTAALGDITVSANTASASLPISISIQETDPGTSSIIGDHILNNLGAGENRTVAVFVTFHGCVSFDPAAHRIFVVFRDASNNVVGSTSTAVSTNR